ITAAVFCFNASTQSFESTFPAGVAPPPLPEPRIHSAGVNWNDRIVIIGGYAETNEWIDETEPVYIAEHHRMQQMMNEVLWFDPLTHHSTNEWKRLPNLLTPRAKCVASVLNNELFVVGGF